MKKVLIFTTAFDPFIGGAEVAVAELAKRLSDESIFFLITYRFDRKLPTYEHRHDLEIFRLGCGTIFDRLFIFPFQAFFQALKLHKKYKIDLIWGVMVSYASIGGYFLKLLHPKIPLLLTLQEGDPDKHLRYGKFGLLGLWWRLLLKRADYIQAISGYLADYAIERGAKQKIAIVPNGVNVEHFSKVPERSELERYKNFFGLKEGDFVAVTVSRLVRKNGIDLCVKAIAKLSDRFKLLIVGDGEQAQSLKSLAYSLKVSDRVIFVGYVPHSELPKYLNLAKVFVRPSRSEGLGNAFLESMAAGVPIIGTPVGGIKQFLKDNETGLFCRVDDSDDLAEKINKIADDETLRLRISQAGYSLVKSVYSWETSAASMRKVFSELLEL